MVGDYVSREYLLGEYDRQHQGPPGGARKIIAEAPAADVMERKKGKWEHLSGDEWICNQCGFVLSTEGSWEHPLDCEKFYCEHCGADLREETT